MFNQKLLSMVLLVGMLFGQSVPRAMAATTCDHAQFVSDLTAPDGAGFAPGAMFTKTWRFMNIGTCAWTTSYNIIFVGGDSMGAPLSVKLPVDVPAGQLVDLSVNLTAPTAPGHYKSLWKFTNASGAQFGIGDTASEAFWVDINVVDTSTVIYDFVANAPYAQWKSGAGSLPYPGTSGDYRGYAYQVDKPHLEDDSFDTLPGLLTVPQNKYNGYIQAMYPEFQVQQGDKLQTLVNCEFGATSCYATFRIDYVLPNNVQKTLWSFKEAYDKRFYRANIDLSSLAGQKVRFIFMLLSTGLANSDRAIWGAPRIIRAGTGQPPAPPSTLTLLPPLTPTQTPIQPPPPTIAPAGCDKASFVTDVTISDGTSFSPGAAFSKTWRLKNSGSCAWTTSYKLTYYSGEQMSGQTSVNLPWYTAPGQTVDITVNMFAPNIAGNYRGYWILTNASGQLFGIGSNASSPVWVEINVTGRATSEMGYDFQLNACSAQWKSGAGNLPCPGTEGDNKGFIVPQHSTQLEDGTRGPAPSLLMSPENKFNGYIQGFYPTFTVQPGDRFRAGVGCEYGYSCYVTFRLDYMTPTGAIKTFWTWREQNEGLNYSADLDLNPLAGQSVRFILTILTTGNATGDRVRWTGPYILRAPGANPPTPQNNDWLTYTNSIYGFQFKYPPRSQIINQSNSYTKINLPIAPGTNLFEKYLETVVTENTSLCQSPLAAGATSLPSETIIINGISFLRQTAVEGAAGSRYEWVAYSAVHNNVCVSMDFVLHSHDPSMFQTPPPVFDKTVESNVFTQIMSTFAWLTAPPTITPTFTPMPPTITITPPPTTGTVVPSPRINKLYMLDTSNGWAIGNGYLLRTTNGGVTWYNVLPEDAPTGGYFPTPIKGWAISGFSDVSTGSLYRTTNGGQSWTRYDVPFNNGYIKFLDDNTGYVLEITGAAMNKQSVVLFKTTDGGATWVQNYNNDPNAPGAGNSLPLGGHKNGMTFSSATTGWVGGDIPINGSIYLYKTTNSGMTWTQQSLPIPAGYENAYMNTIAPKFFGSNDAVLPVWMTLDVGMRDLFIYSTHDGGTTWTRSSAFVRQGAGTDFISLISGITWDITGVFHATNNAGASWSTITPNINFGDDMPDMDFVSTTTGWLIQNQVNGTTPLYRTSDEGATWTLISGYSSPPTPTPDPAAFIQSIVDTLNAHNFTSLPAVMDENFVFAYWQSQGTSYQSDQAIEQLQTGHISATLTSDAGKDLTALLGGTNPYSIMGLDPARSQALFVTGWGLDGKGEAILYITQRPDGSLYWHSVLIAPTGFAPPSTSLIGPYAVIRVAENDVLNIRSGAGAGQPVGGTFAWNAINVMRTGPTASMDGAEWVEVQNPSGGTGWVNSSYLTEYVSHEAFCADTRIPVLIEQLKGSMNQSNGDMFASLVSPAHGTDVRLWAYDAAVNFNTTTARNVFTSTEVYQWGSGPVGGTEYGTGTFAQIIQPKMLEVLNAPNMETYCDDLTKVFPLSHPWPYSNIRFYNLYKPASGQTFDFRTWLIGFEYINNQPYLYGMVTIVWEP